MGTGLETARQNVVKLSTSQENAFMTQSLAFNATDSTRNIDSRVFSADLGKSLEGQSPEKLVLKLSDLLAKAEKAKDGIDHANNNNNENNTNDL